MLFKSFVHLHICTFVFVHLYICTFVGNQDEWEVLLIIALHWIQAHPRCSPPCPINWIESVAGLPLRRKLAQPANHICASVFVFVFVLYCRPDGCSMYGRSQFSMSTLAWSHPSPMDGMDATSTCICIGPPRQIFSHTSVNRISDCDQKYFNAGS